jgi:hypothetical protein
MAGTSCLCSWPVILDKQNARSGKKIDVAHEYQFTKVNTATARTEREMYPSCKCKQLIFLVIFRIERTFNQGGKL